MNCSTTNTPFYYNVQYSQPNCDSCGDPICGNNVYNAKCGFYSGPALPCSEIETNDNLEVALQKIEDKLCQTTGNYATYNTYCLAPVATQKEFVEKISQQFCSLNTGYNTFVGTTFPAYQASVTSAINGVNNPSITCTAAGVISTDTIPIVLNKYCTAINNLQNYTSLVGVNWNQCFTVPTPPTTIAAAFNLINSQLCSIASDCSGLGSFNNIGSCLPSPTANDSAVDTINKIKTRLCQTGTFDINTLTWGCVTKPSVVTTDLQGAMQSIINHVDDYIKNKLTFSSSFNVTQTNPSNPCLGKTVALAGSIAGTDRLVAASPTDSSPGTLIAKLAGSTEIVIDDTTNPGFVTLSPRNDKLKAGAGDTSNGYLIDKIDGKVNALDGVRINESYNATTDKVDLDPVIDWNVFINKMFDEIDADAVLKARFCEFLGDCGLVPPSSTTTTTTTSGGGSLYYLADRYLCGTCTLDVTDQVVQSFVGPLTGNRLYYGNDGYLYYIKTVTTGSPVASIFITTNYSACSSVPCP